MIVYLPFGGLLYIWARISSRARRSKLSPTTATVFCEVPDDFCPLRPPVEKEKQETVRKRHFKQKSSIWAEQNQEERTYSSLEHGTLCFLKCRLCLRTDTPMCPSSPLTTVWYSESSPCGWTRRPGCHWDHRSHEPIRIECPRSCPTLGRSASWSLCSLTGRCCQLREKNKTMRWVVVGKRKYRFRGFNFKLKLNPCKLTFGDDELDVSSEPFSLYDPRASVPALVLQVNLFQTGRFVPGKLRGRWGWRKRGSEAAGSSFIKRARLQLLPEWWRGDQPGGEDTGECDCRSHSSIHLGVVSCWLDDSFK